MIIPSIDLMNGSTVQLVGGREHALDAGDPRPIAQQFAVAGEIAVVDLDAALGKGTNSPLIRELLRLAPCRVGGGIRDVQTAIQWLDAGAAKIVLGTAATPEVLRELPADRVIAALDAKHGEVVVDGWQRGTGESILDRMRRLEGLVSGFLVTFVEREGRMGGTNMDLVPALVQAAGAARVTIAGGVTTTEDVAVLDRLGADAQVGMALYTGRMNLGDAIAAPLTSDRTDGLWPTVVVDELGVAIGLAYSNAESLRKAVADRRGVYHSRTRGLWVKGESSGDTQELLRIDLDCDRDALRFTVRQRGRGFCHKRTSTCWGDSPSGLAGLEKRLSQPLDGASYTARLLNDPDLLRAKLTEEGGELVDATTTDNAAHEAADVLYFAMVAMRRAGVRVADVATELDRRSLRITRRPGNAKPRRDTLADRTFEQRAMNTPNTPQLLKVITPDQLSITRRSGLDSATLAQARTIIDDVELRGELAIRAHAERLGDLQAGGQLIYTSDDLAKARGRLPIEQRRLLERTAERICAFALAQRACLTDLTFPIPGGRVGHTCIPVQTVGCYAPGGRFPLPSSVLMTVITARAAGVPQVWAASPKPTDVTLAAASIAGADGLLAVGGAQAIAALAFGISPVAACDMIVGPGNRWVTAAKHIVSDRVGIDMLAGPSELVVLADDSADPALIAADLLAQAEHDTDAIPILVTTSMSLADSVNEHLASRLQILPTRDTAAAALRNGAAVVTATMEDAMAMCDSLAPEHLQVMTRDAQSVAGQIRNCGAIFVGDHAGEVLCDYGVGPNHVLPTGGTARFRAGLSVLTFLRARTWFRIDDPRAAIGLARDAAELARIESLSAHALAAEARLA